MVAQGSLLPGSAFAGYRIVELVGRGGMGEVYRAVDERLDRPVALKVLAPSLAGTSGSGRACCASPGWRPASTTRT